VLCDGAPDGKCIISKYCYIMICCWS
jgi:hypothetical protein